MHTNAQIVTPVKKVVAPVIHAAPVVPVGKTVAPVVKTYSASVVHSVSVVNSIAAPVVPVVHAAPFVKTFDAAPVAHIVHH